MMLNPHPRSYRNGYQVEAGHLHPEPFQSEVSVVGTETE